MHGGQTWERCRLARWKHGFSSKVAASERKRVRTAIPNA
jgi:hypothetical protein